MSNGQCIQNCATGFSYNATSEKCEKISSADTCLANQTTISGKCYDPCQSGYFMNTTNGQCIQNCAPGFTYNGTSKECEKISSADKCLSTQITISGKCYDPCASGYFMDAYGQCIQNCATGFSYNAVSKECEKNSSADKCLANQTTISGKCYDSCPTGYFMDMTNGQCIQNCVTGFSYNSSTGKCESTQVQSVNCPINTTLINNKCYKNCVNSIMDINGNCITCPNTYTYNSLKNMCVK
jgi:hypothetical protein